MVLSVSQSRVLRWMRHFECHDGGEDRIHLPQVLGAGIEAGLHDSASAVCPGACDDERQQCRPAVVAVVNSHGTGARGTIVSGHGFSDVPSEVLLRAVRFSG